MKVMDYFNLRQVQGDVAVEIEVEGRNLPPAPKKWRAEVDNSLKAAESIEFVMRAPAPIGELADALQQLKKAFVDNHSQFYDSYRAGIHLHVNVQELSMQELATMISTYYIFENSLVNLCNPFRQGNHFCLRAKDAGGQIRTIRKAFKDNNPLLFQDDNIRYSSLNVCAIPKYGSIEFRSLESTEDFGKVENFARLHHSLREFSKEAKTPTAVMDMVYHMGTDGLCKKIFNKQADQLLSQKSFVDDTEQGLELAEDLAHCRAWGVRSLDIFATRKEVF